MTREEFLEESRKQLESFKEEMVELKAKSIHLSEEAKREFDTRSKELEELYHDTTAKYEDVKNKTESHWSEVRDFVLLTNKALKHSVNYFLSHYKNK